MKKLFILPICMLCFFYSCDDKESVVKPHIDLAAESLEFSLEKTGQFEGNVTITGIVRNVGDAYHSKGNNISLSDFAKKSFSATDNDYIPESESQNIIAYTGLLGGGESDTITFKAPVKGFGLVASLIPWFLWS